VNLLGLPSGEWKTPLPADPTRLGTTPVRICGVSRAVRNVWIASPDSADLSLQAIPFKLDKDALSFQIPGLQYWDLILIQWEE